MKNSNGHEFHQYQQNKRAPLILTELTEHKKTPRHRTLEIKVLDWDKYNNVAGLNWLIGSQLSLLITGSPTAKNNKKNLHRFASTQKDYILLQE